MKNKGFKILTIIVFSAVGACQNSANAQLELLVSGGSSHFLGDVGGKPTLGTHDLQDLNLQTTRYMAGLGLRLPVSDYFALRLGGYYARVAGDDKYTSNRERNNRNLNFYSAIEGANFMVQFTLPKSGDPGRFYLLGGVEYFHFDPRTKYNGATVRLQPLGTEGQFFLPGKKPYSLYSFAIPFGVGYNLIEAARSTLSFELILRKTFTDYIDDVSTKYVDKAQLLASNGQLAVDLSDRSHGDIANFSDPGLIRGHSDHNDNFFFLSITYSYKFGSKKPADAGFYRGYHHRKPRIRGRQTSGDGF